MNTNHLDGIMAYGSLSDEELVLKIQQDDDRAFAVLYDRYWSALWRFATNSMKSADDAKDVVQEVFTKFWDKREAIQIRTSVSSFLYRMILNRILNDVKKTKVVDKYILAIQTTFDASERTTENLIYEKELRRCFEEGLMEVPRKARQVFELSRKYEMSHKEISEHLSISKDTVKSHIKISLKLLRNKLTTFLFYFF